MYDMYIFESRVFKHIKYGISSKKFHQKFCTDHFPPNFYQIFSTKFSSNIFHQNCWVDPPPPLPAVKCKINLGFVTISYNMTAFHRFWQNFLLTLFFYINRIYIILFVLHMMRLIEKFLSNVRMIENFL